MTGLHVTCGIEKADKSEPGSSLSENCSIITDSDMSVNSVPIEGFQINIDSVSTQNTEMEVRYPCETNSLSEDCSTSRVCHPGDNRTLQRNRIPGTGDRGRRKRWRGRDECLEVSFEDFTGSCKDGLGSTTLLGCTNMVKLHDQCLLPKNYMKPLINTVIVQDLENSMLKNVSNRIDKLEIILNMKELASAGMAAEVVEEINSMDPDFFAQNPTLLFQLKQVDVFMQFLDTIIYKL